MLLMCTAGPALGYEKSKVTSNLIFSMDPRLCYPNIALTFFFCLFIKTNILLTWKLTNMQEKQELSAPYSSLTGFDH